MCLISVIYEFFQLCINIYYGHLGTLKFDFQLKLQFIIYVNLTACVLQCKTEMYMPVHVIPNSYQLYCVY